MMVDTVFMIDLPKIEGDGEFICLSCGIIISPDDESGAICEVTSVKTKNDDSLEQTTLLCGCGSIKHLVGFEALQEMDYELALSEFCDRIEALQ
jgi:hypothetical protein